MSSLLGAIFKTRYYKHCDILDAYRGYDPSFTWQSIWGAKSLLLEGLGWRVGNGWSINAVRDKWVMIEGKMQAPQSLHPLAHDIMVGDLMDQDTMQWRTDFIRSSFTHTSAEAILALPLCIWGCIDTLFWWYNRDGRYSVQSGYWLARSIHPRHYSNANGEENHSNWQKIWGLDGPPKLKHLLWRDCKNSLPVNVVRHHRHLAVSNIWPDAQLNQNPYAMRFLSVLSISVCDRLIRAIS